MLRDQNPSRPEPDAERIDPQVVDEVQEMKKVFSGLGLALVFNVAAAAQAEKKTTNTSETRSRQSVSSQTTGSVNTNGNSAALASATNLQAELQNTLDVKNAKVGDQVILKTTQAVRQAGQVIVPKGTQLIGRVTEVQKRSKDAAVSRLGLVFDRLQNRDLSIPVMASILSVTHTRAASSPATADLSNETLMTSSSSSRSSSGGSTGGGLLGGVTNTVGGVLNTTTNTVGSVANTATGTVAGTSKTIEQTVNGLQISTSASGSAQSSTTLSSGNENIRLEKGVTFNMKVQRSGSN
jgi:hypothetical protein